MTRKNILITGASSGLGAEMARQFAARGRALALAARRVDKLEELKAEITAEHPGATVVLRELDVNDHDAVFTVFGEFRAELGTIDRVVVNAGVGKGRPIGTGGFKANMQTAETNFLAALAQCEAAMGIFRDQNAGHLVMISSMAAMRGMTKNHTTYAATKAGVSALAEGLRAEMLRTPVKVTTIQPGYIRSELTAKAAGSRPLMVDTRTGVAAMVKAMEREVATACSPTWPWTVIGFGMRHLPLGVVARMMS